MTGPRYAIFFVPPAATALYQFGAGVLGYDSYTGAISNDELENGLSATEWQRLTAEPRKYGFHATLKAPFRLQSGFSERDLIEEFGRFAACQASPERFAATITILDGFTALMPAAPARTLDLLAANCVHGFDRFRAELTAAERSRRLAHPLTPRQIDHLDRWGYPFVLEDFRFHMTLTGRLPAVRVAHVLEFLRWMHERRSVPVEIVVDTIALLRQDAPDSPFRVIADAALQAPAEAPRAAAGLPAE